MNHLGVAHESSEERSKPIPACTVVSNCPLNTDIVLVSSDGHRFGTHCKNLGEFTGGFPLHVSPANGEDVPMPDLNSETLSLFLQYVHHYRQPDLSRVSFRTLNQLAEAVEKYDVYSATEICKVHMILLTETHCVEVFQYASKHGYRKLMGDAALIAVQNKYLSKKISVGMCNRPDLQAAWYRYTEYWGNLFDDCYEEPPPVLHPGGVKFCKMWLKFRNVVVNQVKHEIAIFSSFDSIVEGAKHYLKDCHHCGIRADRWTERVQRHIQHPDSTTPFTSFL